LHTTAANAVRLMVFASAIHSSTADVQTKIRWRTPWRRRPEHRVARKQIPYEPPIIAPTPASVSHALPTPNLPVAGSPYATAVFVRSPVDAFPVATKNEILPRLPVSPAKRPYPFRKIELPQFPIAVHTQVHRYATALYRQANNVAPPASPIAGAPVASRHFPIPHQTGIAPAYHVRDVLRVHHARHGPRKKRAITTAWRWLTVLLNEVAQMRRASHYYIDR